MMSDFGVFDLTTGALVLAMQASDLAQVQIQAPPGTGRVVLEGDYSEGTWRLGEDGWPEQVEVPPPPVSSQDVKTMAARYLRATDWKVTRHRDQLETGAATSLTPAEFDALLAERQAIRNASNRLEAMDPIPADYRDPRYWSQ